MRYFIFLSYRGTGFHGWQRQQNAKTVQQLVEEVISLKLGEDITVTGAGRTDTGVHALHYCAHFDSEREDLEGDGDFLFGMNSFLPPEVAIDRIARVSPDASARYSAISRTYIYRILRKKDPFLADTAWCYTGILDIESMNRAALILMKYSDFASFCRSNSDVKTTICRISEAIWTQSGHILEFKITADRFLRNMVRAIAGTMIEIGQGKTSTDEFRGIIEAADRTRAGQSAPAHGLLLADIKYPAEIFII
ncbi:MAG: tRNA pseudouridine(38-40) synthase TruA [Bacteroidales bacterium]